MRDYSRSGSAERREQERAAVQDAHDRAAAQRAEREAERQKELENRAAADAASTNDPRKVSYTPRRFLVLAESVGWVMCGGQCPWVARHVAWTSSINIVVTVGALWL